MPPSHEMGAPASDVPVVISWDGGAYERDHRTHVMGWTQSSDGCPQSCRAYAWPLRMMGAAFSPDRCGHERDDCGHLMGWVDPSRGCARSYRMMAAPISRDGSIDVRDARGHPRGWAHVSRGCARSYRAMATRIRGMIAGNRWQACAYQVDGCGQTVGTSRRSRRCARGSTTWPRACASSVRSSRRRA